MPDPATGNIVGDIARDADSPTALLLRAIRSLEPEEQDVVLAWLLANPGGSPPELGLRVAPERLGLAGDPPSRLAQSDWLTPEHIKNLVSAHANFGPANLGHAQVVPVRFPVPLYERLKAWSGANGFPIAAVVRGLVERFLDEQPAGTDQPRA